MPKPLGTGISVAELARETQPVSYVCLGSDLIMSAEETWGEEIVSQTFNVKKVTERRGWFFCLYLMTTVRAQQIARYFTALQPVFSPKRRYGVVRQQYMAVDWILAKTWPLLFSRSLSLDFDRKIPAMTDLVLVKSRILHLNTRL